MEDFAPEELVKLKALLKEIHEKFAAVSIPVVESMNKIASAVENEMQKIAKLTPYSLAAEKQLELVRKVEEQFKATVEPLLKMRMEAEKAMGEIAEAARKAWKDTGRTMRP